MGRMVVHAEAELWIIELPDGRHAEIFGSSYPGKEHFAAGPVAGFQFFTPDVISAQPAPFTRK